MSDYDSYLDKQINEWADSFETNYWWKIIDENGNETDGFYTEQEAENHAIEVLGLENFELQSYEV